MLLWIAFERKDVVPRVFRAHHPRKKSVMFVSRWGMPSQVGNFTTAHYQSEDGQAWIYFAYHISRIISSLKLGFQNITLYN